MIAVNNNTVQVFTLNRQKDTPIAMVPVSYTGFRICLVRNGGVQWRINNVDFNIKTGDVFLLNENQKRHFVKYSDEGLKMDVICLERQAFLKLSHILFFRSCIKKTGGLIQNEQLTSIIAEACDEMRSLSVDSYELMSAKMTEFFIKAERLFDFKGDVMQVSDRNMLKILDYIDSHITEDVSLASVAAFAGFTESSFSRKFKEMNGISFKKYVTTRRIELAISILEKNDRNVTDIAYECGFDSISGFYDAFKKVTGTTPNRFSGVV